jgi:ribose transport system ATP-binding protein
VSANNKGSERQVIRVGGQTVTLAGPDAAAACSIGLVPEDRQREGILPDLSVELNIALASLSQFSRWGFIDRPKLRRAAAEQIHQLDIRTASPQVEIRTLSGGNQQKAILGRWFARGVRVLLLEEPTNGVDVGAKAEIQSLLQRFAGAGGSVVICSTDLPQLCTLSDQVFVFRNHELVAHLNRNEATTEVILEHAAGVESTTGRNT